MKAYWNNLNERERLILGAGIIFCFFYLLYLLVYSPLSSAIRDKSQQLTEKQETLLWMQQVRPQQKFKKAPENLTSSKLLTVLAEQLSNASFKPFPYQLQQTGTSDIQLMFDQVPFNPFIQWLWSIHQKYTFSIKQFNIEHTASPGIVKLMLVIATA